MEDDKKNIGPEAEKSVQAPQEKKPEPVKDTPPAPEQPTPGAAETPVVEAAPKAQIVSTVESKFEKSQLPPRRCWISPLQHKLNTRRFSGKRKKP
jgi:hypothetical protein